MTNWTADNKQFSLVFDENPLADFVELPDDGRAQNELWYSNILCGVLRGCLEMVCGVFGALFPILPALFCLYHAWILLHIWSYEALGLSETDQRPARIVHLFSAVSTHGRSHLSGLPR